MTPDCREQDTTPSVTTKLAQTAKTIALRSSHALALLAIALLIGKLIGDKGGFQLVTLLGN